MPFSWGFKKQLSVFGIFAAFALVVVLLLIYFFTPTPTCFDNKQNQEEEGVDCGGSCIPCANKVHDLTILWTRSLKTSEGLYDFAALLENSNQFLKASTLNYLVKLYDANNILIAIKEHSTFIEPSQKIVIFEPNISTQNRVPVRALLEIISVSWERAEAKPLKIDILRTEKFFDASFGPPRVETDIKNQANLLYKNIEATAVLWGGGNEMLVLGVSKTLIEKMDIDESKTIVFTWPNKIEGGEAARVEIFLRQL